MDMFMEAKSLYVMMKMRKMSQKEAAKMLGVSQPYIANKLRLLKINEDMQSQITRSKLTERHARALLRLENDEIRWEALNRIVERGLSVAESEALVDLLRINEVPRQVGKADRLSSIDRFISSTKESLLTLSSTGICCSHKISHIGKKTTLTIIISED